MVTEPHNQEKHLDALYELQGQVLNLRSTQILETYCVDSFINAGDGKTHQNMLYELRDLLNTTELELAGRNKHLIELCQLLSQPCFKSTSLDAGLLHVIRKNQPTIEDDETSLKSKIEALKGKKSEIEQSNQQLSSALGPSFVVEGSPSSTDPSFQWSAQRIKIGLITVGAVLLPAIGVALIATGVLAPFGIALFGVHAVLYSSLIAGGVGALLGGLLGWSVGELVTRDMDEEMAKRDEGKSNANSYQTIIAGTGGVSSIAPASASGQNVVQISPPARNDKAPHPLLEKPNNTDSSTPAPH